MFRLYDSKKPNSEAGLREKILRLEKELKAVRRQENYQFVTNQMALMFTPFSAPIAANFLSNDRARHLSKEINNLKRTLEREEKSLGTRALKDTVVRDSATVRA